jgi:hypothetical protein
LGHEVNAGVTLLVSFTFTHMGRNQLSHLNYGKGDSEGAEKFKSLQPYAPGRGRRSYFAILIERLTSAPRYDISLLGKLCIKLSPHAIHANADGSALSR